MRRKIIGVMGGAAADEDTCRIAFKLGQLIAESGYVLLNGGRSSGVMEHSARGAKSRGGLTVGILPGDRPEEAGEAIDLAVASGMGDARNVINVLSSDVVIACRGGAGTLSEVFLALKNRRRLITIGFHPGEAFVAFEEDGLLSTAVTAEDAFEQAQRHLELS